MSENMMNSDHKCTNKKYRDNYDKIFKNKRRLTMRGIKNKETYQGVKIKQVKGIVNIFNQFFNLQQFDNVYEIGSGNGAFSIYFAKKAKEMNATFTTVDIKPIDPKFEKIINSYGGKFINKLHKKGNVDELIIKGKKNLILIDGAEKAPVFNYLAQYIQEGDYMMAHDYYKDSEYFEYGTFTMKDVVEEIISNELIITYGNLFKDSLWLCVTK